VQHTILPHNSVSCAALQARGCGRVTASLIPRFIPTCSQRLLSVLGQLAQQEGLLVHSHISESRSAASAAACAQDGKAVVIGPVYSGTVWRL
jgi:cytosine/adenosine deaminase-related metal-dependent hydrolase